MSPRAFAPLLTLSLFAVSACADDKTKPAGADPAGNAAPAAKAPKRKEPHPITITYTIAGIKDEKDVEAITTAVKKVETVTDVTGLSVKTGFAAISFDQHAVTMQQVSQAILDAGASLGREYQVSTKIQVPDYKEGDNAGKIDAIFAKHSAYVTIEPVDKAEGVFVIRFKPLKLDPAKAGQQRGFNAGWIRHPISDNPPKGMGLKLVHLHESLPPETK